MNSTKASRSLNKNLKLNNISGSIYKNEDDKENFQNDNLIGGNSRKNSCKKFDEREFGRDISNFVSNCQDSSMAGGNSKDLKMKVVSTEPNLSKNKRNVSIVTTQPTYAFKNYLKKDSVTCKATNPASIKYIPSLHNTSKNKDNPINFNADRAERNPYSMYLNSNPNDKNLKMSNYCRQRKNTSFQLDYPNYLAVQTSKNQPKNPLVKKQEAQCTQSKRKSSAKPKSTSNVFHLADNKENVDFNSLNRLCENYFAQHLNPHSTQNTQNTQNLQNEMVLEKFNFHTYSTSHTAVNTNGTNSKQSQQGMTEIPELTDCNKNFPQGIKECFANKDRYLQIPEHLNEYLENIYTSLKEEELGTHMVNYMPSQTDINEQMRAILIDWLVEVHLKFNLRDETLFLAVNLIDRFLSCQHISRSKLQLLGVSSLMVACKQEEIYTPHVRDFVYITDKAYTKEEVLMMEMEVLKVLDFNILIPSALKFFEIIAQYFNFSKKEFMFGRYLLEVSLMEYSMVKYLPSLLACTAAYITMKFFNFSNYQGIYSAFFLSNSNSSTLKECAKEICNLIERLDSNSDPNTLTAIRRKFEKMDYCQVSVITLN